MAAEVQAEPQSQQSWAAWFLDAYANTAVATHEHEDSHDDSAYESQSPTNSENSSPDMNYQNSFVKTGRGGAGNFQWQNQQSTDIEAQKPKSLKEKRKAAIKIEHIDTSAAVMKSQSRQSSTAYSGRGGAGNVRYIQSNEIQASPTTSNFTRSPVTTSTPVYTGRGGAGNFAIARSMSDGSKLAKEQQEQAEAEKRRIQAEQEVENMLQPPTQAYFGARRRSALHEDIESQTGTNFT